MPLPDGLPVARDLGGLPLVGGGTTRYGRMLRSARPFRVSPDGWAALAAAGLSTIVDLREPGEGEPTTGVPGSVRVLSRPVEVKQAEVFATAFLGRWPDHSYFTDSMREWPQLWVAALDAVADARGAALVHCYAGRDRTGHLVALVLDAAGVERETIVEDYTAGVAGFNATLAGDPPLAGLREGQELAGLLARSRESMARFLEGTRDPRIRAAAGRAGARLRG